METVGDVMKELHRVHKAIKQLRGKNDEAVALLEAYSNRLFNLRIQPFVTETGLLRAKMTNLRMQQALDELIKGIVMGGGE